MAKEKQNKQKYSHDEWIQRLDVVFLKHGLTLEWDESKVGQRFITLHTRNPQTKPNRITIF